MPVYGEGRKGVLVVGEAPGEKEDLKNRPFIGKAGRLLRDSLDEIGVDLDRDAWTTNSLICRPPKNATPDSNQISYCRPNLLNAIRLHRPRVVLTLGRSALVSVLADYWKDVEGLDRWTGWKMPLPEFWLCPTYHPSYLLRMKNSLMDRLFVDHLEQAFSIKKETWRSEDLRSKVNLLYEEADVIDGLREIDSMGGWMAFDYETNCLKPEWPDSKIYSFAASNGSLTIAFLWRPGLEPYVSKFLLSKKTRKIASNLKFEERWSLKHLGHGVVNWGWDTMLASHCLDNRPGITSLKFQALVRMGWPVYNEHVEGYLAASRGPFNRIHHIPREELLIYNGIDAFGEHRLARIQRRDFGYED